MSIFTFITDLIDRFQESQHSRDRSKLHRVNEKLTVERLREQTTDAQVQAIKAEAGMLEAKAGLEDKKAKQPALSRFTHPYRRAAGKRAGGDNRQRAHRSWRGTEDMV